MEKTFFELDKIQNLINLEKEKYKQAINTNRQFEDVKIIYLRIKELQKDADELMQYANELHKNNGK